MLITAYCLCGSARAQPLVFRQLGIEEGLPSNLVHNACFDSSGLIWAGTYDGLVGYDGTRIKQYLSETHPALPDNDIGYLHCDYRNRIWICTGKGLAMLDEQRRMKRIVIADTLQNPDVDYCVDVQGLGMIAITPSKTFLLREGAAAWEPFTWFDSHVKKKGAISHIRPFNRTSYVFMIGARALLVDFAGQKIMVDVTIAGSGRNSICKISNRELLVANGIASAWYRIDIASGAVVRTYTGMQDVKGSVIQSPAYSCALAANGIVYITTRSAGLIGFDPVTDKIHVNIHDPLNERRISTNNLTRIFCHPKGYMMVCSAEGLNFTNTLTPVIRQEKKFVTDGGDIINGPDMIGEDIQGRIWMQGGNQLFIWDAETNRARKISPPGLMPAAAEVNGPAGSICRDAQGNMWVGYDGMGLAKFNNGGKLLAVMNMSKNGLPTNRIRLVRLLADGRLAVGAQDGFFMVNPVTLLADTLRNDPLLLQAIGKKRIIDILADGDAVWVAASPRGGAYHYNFKTKLLRTFTEKEGLSSNRVYCVGKDLLNNVYIGTYNGLNIMDEKGNISIIGKQNGLRHFRVDNIVCDRGGRLWITNYNTLLCYNPQTKQFSYYDEQHGVSNAGFAVSQQVITKSGHILFSNSGILFVDTTLRPALPAAAETEVALNRVYDDGAYDLVKTGSTIRLSYSDAKITLYYLTGNLLTANRFFYRYKMEGLDAGWQQPTKNNQVTYSLKPGKYVFHIQTSFSEGNWKENDSAITIVVGRPWWQTWWFWLLAAAVTAAALYAVYRSRIRTLKARAQVKQQLTELEAKALRAQMNPHFIFNSLNAIQELIITGNSDDGYRYLSDFSKLLRMVLNNSEKNLIPLSAELEMIQLYLSLEALRFKQSFSYTITVDEEVEAEITQVPPLLLQPFVENAVWHGLRHKAADKKLCIRIGEQGQRLLVEIEDNGVGREKALAIKKQKMGAGEFDSKGSSLSQQRIAIVNQQYPNMAQIQITNLEADNNDAPGTRVVITLPLNTKTGNHA